MRCFAACFPVARDLVQLVEVCPRFPGLRPIPRENLHLTLHYFGELDASGINSALARVEVLEHVPVTIEAQALHAFPTPRRARVLVLLVAGPALLTEWHTALAAGSLGEPFRPHISLARTSRDLDLRRLLASQGPLPGLRVQLLPPALYASRLSSSGSRYSRIGGSDSQSAEGVQEPQAKAPPEQ